MRKNVEILIEMPEKSSFFKFHTEISVSSIALHICTVPAFWH
jgi:hypothetical protein